LNHKIYFIHRSTFDDSCGSPDYVSPEVMAHKPYCGCKADVWSLGTVLFALLFAELPFSLDERIDNQANSLPHPPLIFPDTLKDPLSPPARDLIQKMLAVDEKDRISLESIRSHPWMKLKPACCIS